jgi:peptidoglycan/LPS O-acetylase OafA/YrhL
MPPEGRPGLGHQPGLDGLRALAVLLVLYGHAPLLLDRGHVVSGHVVSGHLSGGHVGSGQQVSAWFWHGSRGAWLGVDLFFVLSGFLITSILLAARGSEGAFRRFWLRRALRIFPLAFLYLLVLAAAAYATPWFAHLRSPASFAWAAGYLTNAQVALSGWPALPFSLLWSLAVEEHFYLLWPLIVLWCRPRVVVAVLVSTLLAAPFLRALLLPHLGANGVYVATFCRADTLACGALLAVGWAGPQRQLIERWAHRLLLPALAVIAAVLLLPIRAVDPATPAVFHWLGYSAIAAAFTVCCAAALHLSSDRRQLLAQPFLGAIGRVSYGLYVWHVLTAEVVARTADLLPFATGFHGRVALWLIGLAAVAAASYRWFEAPLLRLKNRLA